MRQVEFENGQLSLVLNTQGPRKGPTLLFLHAGESRSHWAPLYSHLRPKHWRLVAPELTSRVDGEDVRHYSLQDFVADGYEVIRHLNGRPLVLVGSSLGGLMALMLTMRHPLLVNGLVLLDAPVATLEQSGNLLAGNGFARNLLADVLSNPELCSEAARSVSIPTLFLHGTDNPLVGESELRKLREEIPHVETVAVEAGQQIAKDNPQAIAERLGDFVPSLMPEVIH